MAWMSVCTSHHHCHFTAIISLIWVVCHKLASLPDNLVLESYSHVWENADKNARREKSILKFVMWVLKVTNVHSHYLMLCYVLAWFIKHDWKGRLFTLLKKMLHWWSPVNAFWPNFLQYNVTLLYRTHYPCTQVSAYYNYCICPYKVENYRTILKTVQSPSENKYSQESLCSLARHYKHFIY